MPQLPPGSSDQNELTIALTPASASRPVILSGWQRFRARRSIEHTPSQLVVETTERFPSSIAEATTPFSKATVKIGQDQIMGCYIDLVEPHIDKGRHEVIIAARSWSQDLVDCSVDIDSLKAWVVKEGTLGKAVMKLAAPYNIPVTVIGEDPVIDPTYPVIIQPGMTNWQLIEELSRITQTLVYDGVDGGIIISKVGTERSACALIQGQNIELGSARLSGDQRYSVIEVASQAVILDASNSPVMAFNQKARDPSVPRNRNLLIITDLIGPDANWAQQRADWEVARRYGRSREIRIVVSGFRTSRGGALWDINKVVQIDASALKVKEDMIIAGVTFMRDDLGTRTELICMPKAGLMPAPFHFNAPVPVTPKDQRAIDAAAGITFPTTEQIVEKGGT